MSQELDKLALLTTVLEEAFGDGALSPKEQQMIMAVTQLLRIDPQDHQRIFKETEARFRKGEIKREGELAPLDLYRRVVQVARKDGAITNAENMLLEQLSDFLELSADEISKAEAP